MKGRITFGLVALAVAGAFSAGTALATHGGLVHSTALARGAAGELDMHDKSQKLKLQAKEGLDLALVNVTLAAGGTTGWHTHVAPSLVIVKSGSLTVKELRGDDCVTTTRNAGEAFEHIEDAHTFVANTDTEIYIVYMLPEAGSPAPSPIAAPCP